MIRIRIQFVTRSGLIQGLELDSVGILGSLRVNSGPYPYRTDRQRDQRATGGSCSSLFLFCLGSEGKAKTPCEPMGQVRVWRAVL